MNRWKVRGAAALTAGVMMLAVSAPAMAHTAGGSGENMAMAGGGTTCPMSGDRMDMAGNGMAGMMSGGRMMAGEGMMPMMMSGAMMHEQMMAAGSSAQ